MSIEAELSEAANSLADLLEADSRPFLQRHRDANLGPATRKILRVTRSRFRAQRAAVLKPSVLKPFSAREAIAETDEQRRLRIIAQAEAALGPLIDRVPISTTDEDVFAGAIRAALQTGADGVTQAMGSAAPDTESYIAGYLKDGGFTRLTGELDKTTVDRLASAIADAYEDGEDFDGVVKAIKSEFEGFSSARAKTIAQTELNDAYNQSIMHFGQEAGATQKSWETDLAPCLICIENELAGTIDIDEDFPSGDDAAPAHPNCMCSIMVHA